MDIALGGRCVAQRRRICSLVKRGRGKGMKMFKMIVSKPHDKTGGTTSSPCTAIFCVTKLDETMMMMGKRWQGRQNVPHLASNLAEGCATLAT